MDATDLQQIVSDFAELPKLREPLLLAVPAYAERHFRARGIVSVIHDGKLTVLVSSDPRVKPGQQPPACQELHDNIAAGRHAILTESTDLPDMPYISASVLTENSLPIAVLQLHKTKPFLPRSIAMLELFSGLLSSRLSLQASSAEALALAELVTTLATAQSVEDGAQMGLEIIGRHTGAKAGVILRTQRGVMDQIASFGFEADPERELELGIGQQYPTGIAWKACMSGEPQTLAVESDNESGIGVELTRVQPLGWRDTFRYALILRLKSRQVTTPADQGLFDAMSTQLHLALDRLQADWVQDQLLGLQSAVVDADTRGLYQRILQDATDVVPGAQSGTLLVRSSPDRPFRYRASVGYDLDGLKDVELDENNMLNWYGRGVEAWELGEPRMLRESGAGSIRERSYKAVHEREFIEGTERIKSNICMPVAFRGDVLAFINLDNHYNDDAFGEDSVRALRLFAPVVASMLVAARQREQIFGLAHTDTLTRLPNRRGSDLALARQLRRSEELGEPFVLLVMDLRNFKKVNDTFGHEVGDSMLQQVAATLQENARNGDTVSRWGGDEFAVLLPATTAVTGEVIADRLRKAIGGLTKGDVRLGIDIGLAAYPDDAGDDQSLLQIADARMYREKRQHR